jgi:hypothetical protein
MQSSKVNVYCVYLNSAALSSYDSPSMFQVGLASGLGQYTEVVREAQKGLKLRNVRFVDAMGLPFQDGHLHLNTQAQVQLGHMLAQSYLNYGTSTH